MFDEFDDGRPHVPSGGPARDSRSGSIHLSFRSGSRASGASAAAAYAYITRTGEYAEREFDEAVYTESDHMPAWADDRPEDFWTAADENERANGRLYVSADFALPRGLDREEQIALARAFVRDLTSDERLPYTLAIHAGADRDGREHNPHAHVLISERMNDGIDRDRAQWFRRANRSDPSRGGAPKSRTLHGRPWVERARSRWAEMVNRSLASRGSADRVDHRSYARQGVSRHPGEHIGPAAAHMVGRGHDHDGLERAARSVDTEAALGFIDEEIASLERERTSLVDDERKFPTGSTSSGGRSGGGDQHSQDRDNDWMPGR